MKRTLSLILALLLILAMMPALAGSKCPDCGKNTLEKDSSGYNGNTSGGPAAVSCTEPSYVIYRCTNCRYMEYKQTAAPGHKWKYEYSKKPTCTEDGYGTRTCSRCGKTESGSIDALGHSFDWTIVEPTCTEDGSKTGDCSRCGHNWTGVLPATGHDWTGWTVVNEPGNGKLGCRERHCSKCQISELEYFGESGVGIVFTKEVYNYDGVTPFSVGDDIEYRITIGTSGEDAIYDVCLYDPINGSNEDAMIDYVPYIAGGETVSYAVIYTVTPDDAKKGSVVNTASMTWGTIEYDDNGDPYFKEGKADSDTVTVPVAPYVPAEPLTVEKTFMTDLPESEWGFGIKDSLMFKIELTNNTDSDMVITNISDWIDAYNFREVVDYSVFTLSAHDSCSYGYKFSFKDLAEVIAEGPVTDIVRVIWNYAGDSEKHTTESNTVTVWYGEADPDPVPPTGGEVTVEKVLLTELPDDAPGFSTDEALKFRLIITNSTGAPIELLNVTDVVMSGEDTWYVTYTPESITEINGTTNCNFTLIPSEKCPGIKEGDMTDYADIEWRYKGSDETMITGSNEVGVYLYEEAEETTVPFTVTKTFVSDLPESEWVFGGNEELHFTIDITCATDEPITLLAVRDCVTCSENSLMLDETKQTITDGISYEFFTTLDELAPEVLNGDVTDYIAVEWEYADGHGSGKVYSNQVTVSRRTDSSSFLYIEKKLSGADPSEAVFDAGEPVTFDITVTNGYDFSIPSVSVFDWIVDNVQSIPCADIGPLAPGESVTASVTYYVTAADAQRGSVTDYAYIIVDMQGAPYDSGSAVLGGQAALCSNEVTVFCKYTLPDIQVKKEIVNCPESGIFFTENEDVTYRFTIYNDSEITVTGVELFDEYISAYSYIGVLAPYQTVAAEFHYTVTAEDCAKGNVYNSGYVTGNADGTDIKAESNPTAIPTGVIPPSPEASVEVKKQIVSVPAFGELYTPGETVLCSVSITNTGDVPVYDISAFDIVYAAAGDVSMCEGTSEPLAPGETAVFIFSYELTVDDCKMGTVYDSAYVICRADGGDDLVAYSEPCAVNTDIYEIPEVNEPVLMKYEISSPKGEYYTEGETVSFLIVFYNGADRYCDDVVIYDLLVTENSGVIASASEVPPRGYLTAVVDYVVTAFDTDVTGYVTNIAWGSYKYLRIPGDLISNEVTVDCGREPEPKRVYAQSCVKTLVASSNGTELIRTDMCGAHHALELQAQLMEDPAEVIGLWKRNVILMYSALYSRTGSAAFINDRDMFLADISSLSVLMGEEKSEFITDLLRERATELCYELSGLERKDDMLDPATDRILPAAASNSCAFDVTAGSGAWYQTVSTAAGTHLIVQDAADRLISSAADKPEYMDEVMSRVSDRWTAALQAEYRALAAVSPAYTANLSLFTASAEARKAALSAVYPDDAALVNGLIIREIRNRTILLCGSAD